jgi:hypothetical protein
MAMAHAMVVMMESVFSQEVEHTGSSLRYIAIRYILVLLLDERKQRAEKRAAAAKTGI